MYYKQKLLIDIGYFIKVIVNNPGQDPRKTD